MDRRIMLWTCTLNMMLPKLTNMSQVTRTVEKDENLSLQPPKLQSIKFIPPYHYQIPNDNKLNRPPDHNFCYQSSTILRKVKDAECNIANFCQVEETSGESRTDESEAKLDYLNNNWVGSSIHSQTQTVRSQKDYVHASDQSFHKGFKKFPPYILKNVNCNGEKNCEQQHLPFCTKSVTTMTVSTAVVVNEYVEEPKTAITNQMEKSSKRVPADPNLFKPSITREGKRLTDPRNLYLPFNIQPEQQLLYEQKWNNTQSLSSKIELAWQRKSITDGFKVVQVHPYWKYDVGGKKSSQQNEKDDEGKCSKGAFDVLTGSIKDLESMQYASLNQNVTRKYSDKAVQIDCKTSSGKMSDHDNTVSCKDVPKKLDVDYNKFLKMPSSNYRINRNKENAFEITTLPTIVSRCDVTLNNELHTVLYATQDNTMRKDCLDKALSFLGSLLEQNQDIILDKSPVCQSVPNFKSGDCRTSKRFKSQTKRSKERKCSTESGHKIDFTAMNRKLPRDLNKKSNRYDKFNQSDRHVNCWERKWCKLAKTEGNITNTPKRNQSEKEEQKPHVVKDKTNVMSAADDLGSNPFKDVGLQMDEYEHPINNSVIAEQSSSNVTHLDPVQEQTSSGCADVSCGAEVKCLQCERVYSVKNAGFPELLCFRCGQLQNICSQGQFAAENSREKKINSTALSLGEYLKQASREINSVVLNSSLSCPIKTERLNVELLTLPMSNGSVLQNESPENCCTTLVHSKTENKNNISEDENLLASDGAREEKGSWKHCEAASSADASSSEVLNMCSRNTSNAHKKEKSSEAPLVHVLDCLKNVSDTGLHSSHNFTTVGNNAYAACSCVQSSFMPQAFAYEALDCCKTSDLQIQKSQTLPAFHDHFRSKGYSKPVEKLSGILVYSQYYRKQSEKAAASAYNRSNLYNDTELLKSGWECTRPFEVCKFFKESENGHLLTSLQSLHSSDTAVTWSCDHHTADGTFKDELCSRQCPRNYKFARTPHQQYDISKLNVVQDKLTDTTESHDSTVNLKYEVKEGLVKQQNYKMETSEAEPLFCSVTSHSPQPLSKYSNLNERCSSFHNDHGYAELHIGKKRSLDSALVHSLQQKAAEKLHPPHNIRRAKYNNRNLSSSKSFSSRLPINVDIAASKESFQKMKLINSHIGSENRDLRLYLDDVIRRSGMHCSNEQTGDYVNAQYLGRQICRGKKVLSILKYKLKPALLKLLKHRNKKKSSPSSKSTPMKKCVNSVTQSNACSKTKHLLPTHYRRADSNDENLMDRHVSHPRTLKVMSSSNEKSDHSHCGIQTVLDQQCQSDCTTGLKKGSNGEQVNNLARSFEEVNSKLQPGIGMPCNCSQGNGPSHSESFLMRTTKFPNPFEFSSDESRPQTELWYELKPLRDDISKITTEDYANVKHSLPRDLTSTHTSLESESFVFDMDDLPGALMEISTSYNGAQVYMGWIDEREFDDALSINECDQCKDYDLKDPEYKEMTDLDLL